MEAESAELRVPGTKNGPQTRTKMSGHKSEKKKEINAPLTCRRRRTGSAVAQPLACGNLFTDSALEAESNENSQRATEMERRGLMGKK